ncbi:MAG TPA: heme-binding protein [Usitatibacter sp.]|nr:heme-binding protein [Usitatibacter sp.]
MIVRKLAVLAGAAVLCAATLAQAQVPQYGPNITLEQAKKAVTAAEAEARKNSWPVCIAIVDTAGHLVAYHRIDDTQTASVFVCQDKAVSAAIYRRPTKAFGDRVAAGGGGVSVLNLRGAAMSEGGIPIYVGGKVIGAIGVSGVTAEQDGMVAKAGADALK